MLEESLAELEFWNATSKGGAAPVTDFMALDHEEYANAPESQQAELKELRKQIASLQRIQKVTFSQLSELRTEKDYYLGQEKKRAERAKTRARRKMGLTNGAAPDRSNEDVEMTDSDSESDSDASGMAEA
jgi:pre-rRNA-processing protein IPI3